MAKPWFLFENYIEHADTTTTYTEEASGYPGERVSRWRLGTNFRWRTTSTSGTKSVQIDAGSGNTISPDALCIGGHNLGDLAGGGNDGGGWRARYSNTSASGPWTNAFAVEFALDNLPKGKSWTGVAARWWEVVVEGFGSAVPQFGSIVLGRRLDISEGGIPDTGIDPYGLRVVEDVGHSENGHFLGSNVRYEEKIFRLNYDQPGLLVSDFFTPSSGIGFDDNFRPHLKTGDPFWFSWNEDEDGVDSVWLCKANGFDAPFVGSTLRRSLLGEMIARREVS